MKSFCFLLTDMAVRMRCQWAVLLALSLLLAPASAEELASDQPEQLPPGATFTRLEVVPNSIELKHKYDYAQLLVFGYLDTGERLDVTRLSQATPTPQVQLSELGLARPAADGDGSISFTLGSLTASVPVKVSGLNVVRSPSYIQDVAPAMSKMGCNSGTCHGAQQGKNGFQLSLRGYDPIFDHRALTDDLESRRFNRAAPDQSLMLLKPSGGVPHVGGVLTRHGEAYYNLLREWIANGAKLDLDSPRVASIEVFPKEPLAPMPGMRHQMVVYATYTDGTRRDVTAEAFLESSLSEVVEVNKQGLATAVRRGEAAILARYEGAYAATTMVVMGDRTGFEWQDVAQNNHIDSLVYEKLKKVKVQPSELCTDAEFIRRLYLDLLGLPPQPAEVLAFINDTRDTKLKRDEMIDRLVGSPEFVEHWTNKWADLLQVNSKFLGEEGVWTFRNWIRQAVASNMPYDKFVHEILTASGSNFHNPPAAYYKVLRKPGDVMENTTQLFLSVRFNCNKCHDHPFERWTQDQYYQLSAYFAQVGRKAAPEVNGRTVGGTNVESPVPLAEIIYDSGAGEVKHERTQQITPPKFPYAHNDLAPEGAARREQLAQWVTSKDNVYFARGYVNRLWSYLLGHGIIEPVDDVRAGNPPSNPALLDRLTNDFIASGFNVQDAFRTICKSRTYQHSLQTNQWNADDEINYSHALARRLPAETLYDTLYRATGSDRKFPGMPAEFRASQLPDSTVELEDGFLALFGRPPRESACECERSTGVMLGQALNLVNGPTMADAIADPENRIAKLVATEADDAKVIEGIFLAILCRPPTEQETAVGLGAIQAALDDYNRRVAELAAYEANELPARQLAWEQAQTAAVWQPIDLTETTAASGATFVKQEDGSWLLTGTNPDKDTYTLAGITDLTGITGVRLEVLPDASLGAQGPGRAANGNFVLNEFSVKAGPAADPAAAVAVPLQNASADFSQVNYSVTAAVDGNAATGWAVMPQFAKAHSAIFETTADVGAAGSSKLTFTLDQQFGGQHVIGRLRVSVTNSKRPLMGTPLPEPIALILAVAPDQRTPEQLAAVTAHYRTLDADYASLQAAVAAYTQQKDQHRLLGAQDIAWALLNSPAFLFNR